MNKINPLYMLLFFTAIALLMMFQSASTQSAIIETSKQSALLEVDGKYVSALKGKWKDSKKSKKQLDRILSHAAFKNNIVSKNLSKGLYKVQLENLDVRSLDSFVNKVLGESLEIKSLQIDRMSDKNASLMLECIL